MNDAWTNTVGDGVLQGGWSYVWAAYGMVALIWAGYSAYLVWLKRSTTAAQALARQDMEMEMGS